MKEKARAREIRITDSTMRRLRIKSAELGLHQGEVIALALGAMDSGWINVKDGVPKDGGSFWARFVDMAGDVYCKEVEFDGLHWWWLGIVVRVTHWQPLPQPPKED